MEEAYKPRGADARGAEDQPASQPGVVRKVHLHRPRRGPADRMLQERRTDLAPLWESLEDLCRRLETLAHKQLRGRPFNKEERGFIERYGQRLAGVMLYGGNSYVSPRDDAPRVVDVFSNPTVGRVLEVGVGRPRVLYVLYPYNGTEMLCRGAVMPYYEFTHSSRLTDGEWKALLDGGTRPEMPAWTEGILGTGKRAETKTEPAE